MKKFAHGGDIKSFAKKLNCKEDEIIDLSSNINFLKPKISLDFNKLEISSYPKYEKLYKEISKKYHVKSSQIELFNGGSNAIFTLFKHLSLKKCVIYSPAYLEYKKAAKLFSYKLQKINRFKNLKQKIKKNSLVVFVNPSTPDGKYYDLEKLIKYWISKDCTIFIDESFLDFSQKQSVIKYLNSYNKLYILKSMTKFYSSAGIRVGTIISSKENIKKLKKNEPAWKISTFDMNYLLKALKDKEFEQKTINKTTKNKILLKEVLQKYKFTDTIYDSDSNFFLVKLKSITAKKIQKILEKEKIMIRDCSNFDFLDNSYIRVAIKGKDTIERLDKVLNKV